MQASNVCTPTIDHFGTILVAIELSRRSWLVTMHSPDRDRISRHKLCGGDHAGLLTPSYAPRIEPAAGWVPPGQPCLFPLQRKCRECQEPDTRATR
jgi:hypothetical protein